MTAWKVDLNCRDCGERTSTMGEYYNVRDDVWAAAAMTTSGLLPWPES
jgi:hypothetical protein